MTPMNHPKWITHFKRNRCDRPEPDWSAPVTVRPEVLAALLPSLEQFRLGDGGGPASLIAHDAERFRSSSDEMRAIVDFWFAEEAEHARLLGCAVTRFGGRRITSHWSLRHFAFAVARWACGSSCRSFCSRNWSARRITACCAAIRRTLRWPPCVG